MNTWVPVSAAILTLVGVVITAKLASGAQAKKTDAEKDISSGQLALDIANRLDGELKETKRDMETLQRGMHIVRAWWRVHEKWDDAVVLELPDGAIDRLPHKDPFPIDPF